MQPIPVIWCLGLLTACAAGAPPAPTAPARRAAPVVQAERADTPSPLPPSSPAAELEPREQQEDATLRKAALLYQEFIDRAGSDPSYAEAVRRSRERMVDIQAILRFREDGRRERARGHGGVE